MMWNTFVILFGGGELLWMFVLGPVVNLLHIMTSPETTSAHAQNKRSPRKKIVTHKTPE